MEKTELAIIGAGPAGLSAAIYTARAGVDTQLFGNTPKYAGDYDIDNYYGFPETISGRELHERGVKQAERFGVTPCTDRVLGVHHGMEGGFEIKTEAGTVKADSVIIATGVSRVRPGIKNLPDYEGKGVSYCVSCDGFFFREKPVIVVGEKNYAANQALELTQYTPKVTLCTQGKPSEITDEFKEQLTAANIPVIEQKIETLLGENGLEQVAFADESTLDVHGLFVAMGEASGTDFAYTLGLEREGEFVKVDYDQTTNIPGVYAAGDCCGGFLQISVAVGEGAKAGRAAIKHVRKVRADKQ